MTKIFHNPRCSKSRETLELIKSQGIEPTIVEYLKDTPDSAEIQSILTMLGAQPRDIMRTGEKIYKELGLDDVDLSNDILIEAMVDHPNLIERPIVVANGKAALGRPPKTVLDIL